MDSTILQSLDFYTELLSSEGYDNYFRLFERDLVSVAKEYTEIIKIDKTNGFIVTRDFVDNDDDGLPYWLDNVKNPFTNYIVRQTRKIEKEVQIKLKSEIQQISETSQLNSHIPLLIGQIALLNRMISKSSFNYKSTIVDSLNRLEQSIWRILDTAYPEIIDKANFRHGIYLDEKRIKKMRIEQSIGFKKGDITDQQYKRCIDTLYNKLKEKDLLEGNVKVLFNRAFKEPLPKKIIWKGGINDLHNLIATAIAAKMIIGVKHWSVAAACFKLAGSEFTAIDIRGNSHKAKGSFALVLKTIKEKLESIIPSKEEAGTQSTKDKKK